MLNDGGKSCTTSNSLELWTVTKDSQETYLLNNDHEVKKLSRVSRALDLVGQRQQWAPSSTRGTIPQPREFDLRLVLHVHDCVRADERKKVKTQEGGMQRQLACVKRNVDNFGE